MKKDELPGRKPFYDGPIDIKRWKAQKRLQSLLKKIRSLTKKERG